MPKLVHRAPRVLVPLRLPAEAVEWADQVAAGLGKNRIEVLRAMCRIAARHGDEVRTELRATDLCRRTNCACASVPGWPRTGPTGATLHVYAEKPRGAVPP